MAEKDQITCHVLDTTTGRPAVNIAVTLCCGSVPSIQFTANTNRDGRITRWTAPQGSVSIAEWIKDQVERTPNGINSV